MPRAMAVVSISVVALLVALGVIHLIFNGSCGGSSTILNLGEWKLTLPVAEAGSAVPQEIKQPALSCYKSWYFHVNSAGTGVVFQARVGGASVVSGGYARTELREMTDGGRQKAAWSSRGSINTMTIRESIDHLPPMRPSIVAGQIHGPDDHYVALVRLDGTRLYVKTEAGTQGILDNDYRLGTIFTLKLVSSGNTIRVYYDGALKDELHDDCTGCYFKAGAYLQSSTKWDQPDAYGRVTIYNLQISHEAS